VSVPTATLGGVTLANASAVGWTQTVGVAPSSATFTVHRDQWEQLKGKVGRPLTLVTGSGDTWRNLYIIREVPASIPYHVGIVVVDPRYYWDRILVRRSYNITRVSGVRTIVQKGPVELAQPVDELSFKQPSLNNGKRHTARSVLEDVLKRVGGQAGHGYTIRPFPGIGSTKSSMVQNLELVDNGASAISRCLGMIPGAEITMDESGQAVVFDATDVVSAAANLRAAGPETQAGQVSRWVSLAAIRPRAIRVYFERQLEVRFDSVEEGSEGGTVSFRLNEDTRMQLENVMPLPDVATDVVMEGNGVAAPQGTYVPIRTAAAAYNEDIGSLGGNVPSLSMANIRKYWLFLEGIWGQLGNVTSGAATANWSNRISAIRQHYRQTYQIPRPWHDRMRDLRAYRVGILHPVTGTRGPAMAWADHAIEPNQIKWAYINRNNPELQNVRLNRRDYPGFDEELVDSDASPADVTIPEPDLGIVHIGYRTDPYGNLSRIHPSRFKESGTGAEWSPNRNLEKQNSQAIADDGRTTGGAHPFLATDHRAAIVITATPNGPNDETRLHYLDVLPSHLPADVAAGVQAGGGKGPVWEVYIPPTMLTAWYAWTQTTAARKSAKAVFGVDGAIASGEPPAGYTIVNGPEGHAATGDSVLAQVARATAASIWAGFMDGQEGSVSVRERVGVTGNIQTVAYTLSPDGRMLATVSFGPARKGIPSMGLLPPAARAMVLREVPM